PIQDLVPFFEPMQLFGGFAPELLGVIDRLAIHLLVLLPGIEARLARECRRRRKKAVLLEDRINSGTSAAAGGLGLGHVANLLKKRFRPGILPDRVGAVEAQRIGIYRPSREECHSRSCTPA